MSLPYSKLLEAAFGSFNLDWSTEWSPTPKNLPLLRLPFFALLEVFKNLDPNELFILSQCSRKAAGCIHIVGSKKWRLTVNAGQRTIKVNNNYELDIIEKLPKPPWEYNEELRKFFRNDESVENGKLELHEVLSQVQAVFRCPVTSFEYNGYCYNDRCCFSTLKHITQTQTQPLESLYLYGYLKTEYLEWVFQNVKVTQRVNITLLGVNRFSSDLQSKCERLDFMTLNSCKYIELTLSSVTIHGLNVFMKEWKTGSYPNLQYLLIRRCYLSWVDKILGFDRDDLKQLGLRRRLVIDERSVECTGGVDIQADNGTEATMQWSSDMFRNDCTLGAECRNDYL
ncbi:hypothetical protein CAEBREN_11205 [Caenorhabditis brenneri]|uniref:F-box domain-containing protein n=1 Tax=Caenorhabditis brenneri TaxID=135651 RepID=G0N2C5_CAEBE|nr:hypothetical protein CAEBREN_11205 [Caenorhabditis brenneri]